MNGNETDVDCGGSCAFIKKCGETLRCITSSDCMIGTCKSNICQGEFSHKRQNKRKYRKYCTFHFEQLCLNLYENANNMCSVVCRYNRKRHRFI